MQQTTQQTNVKPAIARDAIITFAAVVSVMLVSMAATGVFPFGDHVMLYADSAIQYNGFFGWFSRVLHGDASLLYSFGKSLGGPTLTLFVTYLASPVNLLAYFFDYANMPTLFSILIPLKIAAAGATCSIYISNRFKMHGLPCVVIACCYSLAACHIDVGSNVMWLDAVVMLPLVCLAVWRLVSDGKMAMLYVCVGLSVIFCWYGGYIVCLAACLCFFAECFTQRVSGKLFLRRGLRFAACMVLGLLLAMPLFLPALCSMFGSESMGDSGFLTTIATYDMTPDGLLQGLECMFMGGSNASSSGSFTTWLIGTSSFPISGVLLALSLSGLTFIRSDKRSDKRFFVIVVAVFVVFLASFFFKPLDMVWTVFTRTNSYSPRYYFVFVFALCALSAAVLSRMSAGKKETSFKRLAAAIALMCVAVIVFIATGWVPDSWKVLALQAFVVVVASAGLVALVTKREVPATGGEHVHSAGESQGAIAGWLGRPSVRYALALAVIVCFSVECVYLQTYQMGKHYSDTSLSAYKAYVVELEQVLEEIPDNSRLGNSTSTGVDSLRQSKSLATTPEQMAFGFMGIDHYSSTGDQAVNNLLGNLGYCRTPGSRAITNYRSPNYLMDSILGFSGIIAGTPDVAGYTLERQLSDDPVGKARYFLSNQSTALPIVYAIDDEAESFDWTGDIYTNQEKLLSQIVGSDVQVYRSCDATRTWDGAQCTTFTVTAAESGPLMLSLSSESIESVVRVYCDGEFLQTFGNWAFDTNLIYLGNYSAGETAEVRIEGDIEIASAQASFKSLDMAQANYLLESIDTSCADNIDVSDGHVTFTTSSEDSTKFMLTVPTDERWEVSIDGASAQTESFQGFITIEVPAGTHFVEMNYRLPKSLLAGVGLSVFSIAGIVCAVAVTRRRDRKEAASRELVRS